MSESEEKPETSEEASTPKKDRGALVMTLILAVLLGLVVLAQLLGD